MQLTQHWQLSSFLTFLNHGCFGSVPRVVGEAQKELRDQLEADPVHFLAPERELESKLDRVRGVIADFVNAKASNLVFVRNATDGVNAVLRSMTLVEGDEIVVTNHGYNACTNAANYVASRSGARVRVAEIPFPVNNEDEVVAAVDAVLSDRTRLLLLDHVTSPTALVFPIERLIALAHDRGARVMIDGAHAAGMLPLNLRALGADYYTANHHKWLCAPKVSGFLYVAPEYQDEVQPTVISHPYNRPRPGRSQFTASFDWVGTYDPSPLLTLPKAIDFMSGLMAGGFEALMRRNHDLILQARDQLNNSFSVPISTPDSMLGSMYAFPLAGVDPGDADSFRNHLREEYGIEVPVYAGVCDPAGKRTSSSLLRISIQAYNDLNDIQRLIDALWKTDAVSES